MKKVLIVAIITILLGACSEPEYQNTQLEFIELERTDAGNTYAIFADHVERLYFRLNISSYDYDNWNLNTKDLINVKKDTYLYENFMGSYYYAIWEDYSEEKIKLTKTNYIASKN